MSDINVDLGQGITVDLGSGLNLTIQGAGSSSTFFEIEEFDAGADLSAGQRSGALEIPTANVFLSNSLQVLINNIPQTRDTHYIESPDNDGITMLVALQTDDVLELRYARN